MRTSLQQQRGTYRVGGPGQTDTWRLFCGPILVLYFIILSVAVSTLLFWYFYSAYPYVFFLSFLLHLSPSFIASLTVYISQKNLSNNVEIIIWLHSMFQEKVYKEYRLRHIFLIPYMIKNFTFYRGKTNCPKNPLKFMLKQFVIH